MHLGFQIFDLGFQSPNMEAAKPMLHVPALLHDSDRARHDQHRHLPAQDKMRQRNAAVDV